MEEHIYNPKKDPNKDGYKVPGDGLPPNDPPKPGNHSFETNPNSLDDKKPGDIPGKEFNINDKAYSDSTKKDFVETVSKMNHANESDSEK
ncbi:hypothetical protein FNO01nite_12820 [Flavobacterium noncentrifugens]|nr:hypothetical protein [Flavobacterium noncentrifugens]GEP50610.1 hypothetical protein FNO01nite_12820 [Flavobacterium noncentrifugens]